MNEELFSLLYNLNELHPFVPQLALFAGVYLPYLLVLGLAIYLFFSEEYHFKKRLFVTLAAIFSSALSYLAVLIIRSYYEFERPFAALPEVTPLIDASDKALNSFPSGHTTLFFALGMFLYFYHKRLGVLYLVGALFVGIGRIVAGVHWPLDILAGAVLGILGAYLIRWFTRSIKKNL